MLTQAQYVTLKNDILANADMNTIPLTNAGNSAIRDLYNAITTTDLWGSAILADAINNAVDISKYTPADPVPTVALAGYTLTETLLMHQGRVLACQTKLMALQSYILKVSTIDATKATIRAGIRDSCLKIPAGTNGAEVNSAGASAVVAMTACTRKANRFEKLFATVAETTGTVTAFIPVLQGQVSLDDIAIAREMP